MPCFLPYLPLIRIHNPVRQSSKNIALSGCNKFESLILTTSYLPPSWYIEQLIAADVVFIESSEHFIKQTIRNRCHILSPNGVQTLIVPVVHLNRTKSPIKDIRISNDFPWQRQHWRSLTSAYRRSAFFEFYQDDLIRYYEKRFDFLFDFNQSLLLFLLEQIKVEKPLLLTTLYQPPVIEDMNDLRNRCNTRLPVETGTIKSYPQVFGYKDGFVPGLSVVDLLFSMGSASRSYLQES